MAIARVKWFNREKKCGSIVVDDREILVNFSGVDDTAMLETGRQIECDIVKGPRGERVINF